MFLSHFLISPSPRLGHECSIGRISRMTIHLIDPAVLLRTLIASGFYLAVLILKLDK